MDLKRILVLLRIVVLFLSLTFLEYYYKVMIK